MNNLTELWAAALSSYAIHGIALSYFLWIFYLAVTNLQRAYEAKTISKIALTLGIPVLVIGLILDVLVNIFVISILLLEIPKEWLVTTRLKRHVMQNTWRGKISYFICHYLLDTFDPSGSHCK